MLKVALWEIRLAEGLPLHIPGRYAVLRDHFGRILEREGSIDIENRARFGATAEEGWRILKQLRIFLHRWWPLNTAAMIATCPADIANNPEGIYSPKVELSVFEKTVRFVSAVRERGLRPLLVTPPPLHAPAFLNGYPPALTKPISEFR